MDVREDKKVARQDLGSWKEIARYLGVTVRTAQKWEVERALPVKRLGGPKGRVCASPESLDHWREESHAKPRWWTNLAFLRAASVTVSAILLVQAGILIGLYAGFMRKGPPAGFIHDYRTLVVTDEQGHELWRKTFAEPLLGSSTPERKLSTKGAWFGDLDADGHVELLYIFSPEREASRGASLYCFSDKGEVKWQFVPGRLVRTRTETFAMPFIAEAIAVLRAGPDGKRRVVVSSRHAIHNPAQVALLACDGQMLGEYWHSGRLPGLDVSDLDGDGVEEIVLGGASISNKAATVVVLDSRNVVGASAEMASSEYQLLGFPPSHEKARILLSRTCINQKLDRFNRVYSLSVNSGQIHLRTWERSTPVGLRVGVNYTLNSDLKVTGINYTDRLRSLHREMEASGQLLHPLTEEEIQRLREVRVLVPWSGAGQPQMARTN